MVRYELPMCDDYSSPFTVSFLNTVMSYSLPGAPSADEDMHMSKGQRKMSVESRHNRTRSNTISNNNRFVNIPFHGNLMSMNIIS